MMNLLAIDTSTEFASVALAIHGKLYNEEQSAQRLHAQFILPMIERLLAQASCQLAALDGIVFGCGPGSFTGLRIACSVAKGLAYAHNLHLYPVSSLAAIIEKVSLSRPDYCSAARVLAMIDARMQQVYWTLAEQNGILIVPEQVSSVELIDLQESTPLILAGVGYELYQAQLPLKITNKILSTMTVYPHAEAMIGLVNRHLIKPVFANEASPVYIRNQVTY